MITEKQLNFDNIESDLQAKFWEFHIANPQVYALFERFTFEVIMRGFRHYSADAIIHRVRWETSITTTDNEFKINDHHTAYYARRFHANHPEHDGFFRLRGVRP